MAIIAITGIASSGKDTVANMIQYYFCKKENPNVVNVSGIETYLKYYSSELNCSWQIKKFATKLKEICCILTGCTVEQLEDQKFKESLLPEHLHKPGDNPTYRWLLQTIGTEVGRNINKNIWIESLFAEYRPLDIENRTTDLSIIDYSSCTFPNWIISDLRFLNEASAIKSRKGSIIKIERGFSDSTHSSETELSKIIPDYTILNNGTIEQLYNVVIEILKRIKL